MKRLFRLAREQPVFAALALDKNGAAQLLVDKRKPDTALERQMRTDVPGGTLNRHGTVSIDPDDSKLAVFTVNKEAPGMARRLIKALKGTGIARVRFRLDDGTICESAEGEPDPEEAPTEPADPNGAKTRLTEQVARIAGVLAQDPARKDGLLALATQARDHLKAGDLDAAEAGLATLKQAIDSSPETEIAGDIPRMTPSEPAENDAALKGVMAAAAPGAPKPKPLPKSGPKSVQWLEFKAFVPKSTRTVDEMYRIFEVVAYGRVTNSPGWECQQYCNMDKNQGKVVPFRVPRADVTALRDPAAAKRQADDKAALNTLPGPQKSAIETEAARRYIKSSGERPGPDAYKHGTGQADVYDRALSSVMRDRELLKRLPPDIAALLGGKGGGEYDPKTYAQLIRIVDKLKAFSPEDLALYKSLPLKAADNLDLFEQSLAVFVQRKAELIRAIQEQQAAPPQDDPTAAVWKDFDGAKLGAMTEDEREALARKKANEVAAAQLKYLADHPGEALKGLAKSATLLNTGETMTAIGKDIAEAADGDANAYARWAAGAGAGAKLSGWLLAAAGVLYVASWLTGIGELVTIGAVAIYALGAIIALSLAEEKLRIKAASQETDPEKFKHDTEAAGQAHLTFVLTVATLAIAFVLHYSAKALFPNQVAKLKLTLKTFRDRLAKGTVASLKPSMLQELAAQRTAFAKSADAACALALDTAKTLEALSTLDFVERLDSDAGGGFLDHGSLPAEQKIDFAELMNSPTGRSAIEAYKARLIQTLRTDVPTEIERLAQQYVDGIDTATKAIEAADTHDDLATSTGELEKLLGEEHAKRFMQNEQDALVKQKLLESLAEANNVSNPATDAVTRQHMYEGGRMKEPHSPYNGKWDGGGLHEWKALQNVIARDGFKLKSVAEDPASGTRRVDVERIGTDPKTGKQTRGVVKKTIYPKRMTPEQIDAAGEAALRSAQRRDPGTKLDVPGTKLKSDGSPADGYSRRRCKLGSHRYRLGSKAGISSRRAGCRRSHRMHRCLIRRGR